MKINKSISYLILKKTNPGIKRKKSCFSFLLGHMETQQAEWHFLGHFANSTAGKKTSLLEDAWGYTLLTKLQNEASLKDVINRQGRTNPGDKSKKIYISATNNFAEFIQINVSII